jgi:two-component system nitrogen regulation response regulator GlnG
MTPATQTKILRVLQSGTFERVGGNTSLRADVRVIAATNKPLEQAVAARQFREDLFYRLNVVRIHMPPLRERKSDIRLLVDYFLKKLAREQHAPARTVSAGVLRAFEKYHWPGNVRELENVIRRALVVSKGDTILPSDLGAEIAGIASGSAPISGGLPPGIASGVGGENGVADIAVLAGHLFHWARKDPSLRILPAVERALVIEALKATNDNQVQAAKLLGVTRATLRKRIEKFGIQRGLQIK